MKTATAIIFALLIVGLVVVCVLSPKLDILKASGIANDEDYQKYLDYKSKGFVTKDDKYIIKYQDPDKIRVTFAENKNLEIEYYFDKEMTKKITETAYLECGDTIYIKFIETKGENKNLYKFARYDVYEIKDLSEKERSLQLEDSETHYTIPENTKIKEIQIIPRGIYTKKSISFNAFCSGESDTKEVVNTGIWKKNKDIINNNILDVLPGENYTITYKYNADEYFFYKSSPECFSCNQENGTVEFVDTNSSDLDHPTTYNVELKRYLTLNFEFDKKATVMLNDVLLSEKTKKYNFTPKNKLNFGDKITIETVGDIKIVDGAYKYLSITRDFENDTYKYIISIDAENYEKQLSDKICQEGVDIVEDVSITLPEGNKHGVATYTLNSDDVSGTISAKEDDEIKIKYTITKKGYTFKEQNFVKKIFNGKSKSKKIKITISMNDTTLNLDEYFELEKED